MGATKEHFIEGISDHKFGAKSSWGQLSLDHTLDIADGRSGQRNRKPSFLKTVYDIWHYQLISAIIAAGSFFAIYATIKHYTGKPLPEVFLGITINAIVSVLAFFLKASMGLLLADGLSHLKWIALEQPQSLYTFDKYDEASRGFWGALTLLFSLQSFSKRGLASLGALAVILIVPLDPFFQQLLQYEPCPATLQATFASLARIQVFQDYNARVDVRPEDEKPSHALRGAFNQAMFAHNVSYPIWDCRTGNCTFPTEYTSIGYSVQCIDTTDRLKKWWSSNVTTFCGSGDWCMNATTSFNYSRYGPNSTTLTFSHYLTAQIGWKGRNGTDGFVENTTYYNADVAWNLIENNQRYFPSMTVGIETGGLVSNFTFIRAIPGKFNSSESPVMGVSDGMPHYVARECSFKPVLRSYFNSSLENFRLKETPTEHADAVWYPSDVFTIADMQCAAQRKVHIEDLQLLGYDDVLSSRWLPYRVYFDYVNGIYAMSTEDEFISTDLIKPGAHKYYEDVQQNGRASGWSRLTESARSLVPKECLYHLADLDNYNYALTLAAALDQQTDGGSEVGFWERFRPRPRFRKYVEASDLPNSLRALYYTGSGNFTVEDVSAFMQNVVAAADQFQRATTNRTLNKPASGEVHTATLCLRVDWRFFYFPAAMLAWCVLFLVALIWQSWITENRMSEARSLSGSHNPPLFDFKSSPLPLLLSQMNGAPVSQAAQIRMNQEQVTEKQIKDLAKNTSMTLEPTADGWRVRYCTGDASFPTKYAAVPDTPSLAQERRFDSP